MGLRVAHQMDPIESINPRFDSTFFLGIEAQKRGHELWYYQPRDLSFSNGKIIAKASPIKLYPDSNPHYELSEPVILDLSEINVILLRQDPPFDLNYYTNTLLLERLQPKVLIVNDPVAVRNYPEKMIPLSFKEFMPPTIITTDRNLLQEFWDHEKDIVLKPLYGNGGNLVFHIKPNEENFLSILESTLNNAKEPIIAQKFIPEIYEGEIRANFVDGEIAGVFLRTPAKNHIRNTMRIGGVYSKGTLTSSQKIICDNVADHLKKLGIMIAGIDIIGNYLTEVNITSTGAFRVVKDLGICDIGVMLWDAIEKRVGK